MRKLSAIRANIGYINESSVSDYYSDKVNFEGLSSVSSSVNTVGYTESDKKTTFLGEDQYGTVSNQSRKNYFTKTGNSKRSFTNEMESYGGFKSTTKTSSGEAGTTFTHTETNSYSRESKNDRFNHSTEALSTAENSFTRSFSFSRTSPYGNLGETFQRSLSQVKTTRRTTTETFNSTMYGFSSGGTGNSGSSSTRIFLTRDSDNNIVLTQTQTADGGAIEYQPYTDPITTNTKESSRIRERVRRTISYSQGTSEAAIPETSTTESTATVINKSLYESEFTYTQKVTTWTQSSTYAAAHFEPSYSTESFYDTEGTTQIVVSSFYQVGSVIGYVPLDSLTGWVTTQISVSDLTSSISYYDGYLPNRDQHEKVIVAGSNDNQNLSWHDYSQVYGEDSYNTSESITYSYRTEEKNNIIVTELPTQGNFHFGKTSEMSTQYTTETVKTTDYTNLEEGTIISYIQTFVTDTLDGLVTANVEEICQATTSNSTFYIYSSDADSYTKQTLALTTSRDIGFFAAGNNGSYTSTYFVIKRDIFPFFGFGRPNRGGKESLISIKWGGFDAFQTGTNSTKITGIPEINFTDQYITAFTGEVTDVSLKQTVEQVQTSYGSTMVDTQDDYLTTTTFLSQVIGQTITETDYTLQLYDNSYKLNRYFTYIPVNDTLRYMSDDSSFESTDNNDLSVTHTLSQILAMGTDATDITKSYSKKLLGIRKKGQFGSVVTRESPYFGQLNLGKPLGGEIFVSSAGTIFVTGDQIDRDFDPTIFTGTESTDYLTFDLDASNVISSTITSNIILKMKNTHGLIKGQDAYEYVNYGQYGGNLAPVGERYFFGAYQSFPECHGHI